MVEAKDIYTRGHSDRVSYYTTLLAKKRIQDPQRLELIRLAGLFHDVGKIGVPDSILTKLGPLSEEEFAQIRRHSELGCQILSTMSFFQDIAGIIRGVITNAGTARVIPMVWLVPRFRWNRG